MKKHLTIILFAFIFALWIYFFVNNSNMLASVLSINDYNTIKENQRDIAYKNTENVFEIFVSDSINNIETLEISLLSNTEILEENISWQWNITRNNDKDTLTTTWLTNIDYNYSIIEIAKDTNDIILVDIALLNSNIQMKVWNLSEENIHAFSDY